MKHSLFAVVMAVVAGAFSNLCAGGDYISDIERRNSTNAEPLIADEPLSENVLVFVDRAYEYVSVPTEIAGAQYIRMANNDKNVVDFEMDVTLAARATLLLFIDNRVGNDGLAEHPPDYSGITPDLSSEMAWAADMGFADMGVDIGIDESGNGVANYWFSVYSKEVPAGTITLLKQKLYSGGRNMYGVAAVAASGTASVIYVDDDCMVAGADGSSWQSAYGALQNALADANAGDEIRVAQGVYRPDRKQVCGPAGCSTEITASGDREATFELKDAITVMGGYPGLGHADPNARNINLYETILSGDLNGDDGPNFANNAENSYTVVTGNDIDSSIVIDGFTVTGGNANDDSELDDPAASGAGMFNYGGSPIVSNCTFRGNFARNYGGAMFNMNCGDMEVINCRFAGNRANRGGAVVNSMVYRSSFENCLLSGNMATEAGGGMACSQFQDGTVINCTFAANRASGEGSGMHMAANCETLVTNCIFSDNWDEIADDGTSTITVTYSNVPGGVPGEGNLDADPYFADDGYWDGNGTAEDVNDDMWIDGDYHLKSQAGRWDSGAEMWVQDFVTSPCIDTGDPNSDWREELWPHGKRINIGVYGGFAEASMSASDSGIRGNVDNRDCVDFNDVLLLAGKWCMEVPLLAEDIDRSGEVDSKDFAILAEDWHVGLRPDTMTWFRTPYATSSSTIAMAAEPTISCDGGDVEYYFEGYNEPANNSGWLSFPAGEQPGWEDSGLLSGQEYCYRAKARSVTTLLETDWSVVSCSTPSGTDWPPVFEADFEDGSLDLWEATDPSAWRIEDGHGGKVLSLFKNSSYSPPYRSPFNISLVRDVAVESFDLELDVLSTNNDYNHRDLCLFFGYQDDSHFYYVHLGKTADPTANSVFIVDNADRTSIASYRTGGVPWDYNWHRVRLFRNVETGDIEVYFDDMSTPIMTAVNSRFLWGRVGVGSFDDIGQFDNVKLYGQLRD